MPKEMKSRSNNNSPRRQTVFISWSDNRGKVVASILKQWLELVLPKNFGTFVSSDNIRVGEDYFRSLTNAISSSIACMICVTKMTPQSTWVAFEAGLAYAAFPRPVLCPILFDDVNPNALGPLNNLQMRHFNRADLFDCLTEIVERNTLNTEGLRERFESNWPDLDRKIKEVLAKTLFPEHDVFLSPAIEDRSRDLADSNQIMQAAQRLDLLALTYVTLSRKISQLTFDNLTDITVRTYALPHQRNTHPTHVGNFAALTSEWTSSISTVLKALCDRNRCPNLKSLQFVILSASPDFTGTYAEWRCGEKRGSRLRLTLCVSGFQMSKIPTFIVDFEPEQASENSHQFLQLFRSTGLRPSSPLCFDISPHASGEFIDTFVKRAAKVTNHPGIPGQQDLFFSFAIRPGNNIRAQSVKPANSVDIPRMLGTPLVASSLSTGNDWRAAIDNVSKSLVVFSSSRKSACVETQHFFANFVILLEPSDGTYNVVLVNKPKGPWDYDIPGGKYASTDSSAADNVCREVFEELGWILDPKRLKGPIGLNYDHTSLRESGKPGLIQYFYYVIVPSKDWQSNTTRPQRSTTKDTLCYKNFAELVSEKATLKGQGQAVEPLCHVPLKVLEALATELCITLSLPDAI